MDGAQKKDIFECVYFPGGILEYQIGLRGNLIFTEVKSIFCPISSVC